MILGRSSPARSNTWVIGEPGTGKSKLLEHFCRGHISRFEGFMLLDWHGTLYRDVLNYLAYVSPGIPVYLLNPSEPQWIVPFNPFLKDGDPAVAASRQATLLLRAWKEDPYRMPTFHRITKMVFYISNRFQIPLTESWQLIAPQNAAMRQQYVSKIDDPYMRHLWLELESLKSAKDWINEVRSFENRLADFITEKGIRRFFSQTSGNLDLDAAIDNQAIILVNLAPSRHLSENSARAFAALLIAELFDAAMRRSAHPRPYALYCDEFYEYMTPDLARMLDQVRKTGLRVCLAHQNLAQLDPQLLSSLRSCGEKYVFRTDFDTAYALTPDLFLSDLNTVRIKRKEEHTTHDFIDDERYTGTDVINYSDSYDPTDDEEKITKHTDSYSMSLTKVPFLRPVPRIEEHEIEWSLEEKKHLAAQTITSLPPRRAIHATPHGTAFYDVPEVKRYLDDDSPYVVQFMQEAFKAVNVIPADEPIPFSPLQERTDEFAVTLAGKPRRHT